MTPAPVQRRSPVRGADLIGATLLFSLLLHGILILGLTFHYARPQPSLPTLDVSLVDVANQEAPDRADFLAQASNRGGGDGARASAGCASRPELGCGRSPA